MGKIKIKDLKLKTIIGCLPKERIKKNNISISLLIDYDFLKAEETDNIKNAIDYFSLSQDIVTRVKKTNFFLLEKLTSYVLDIVFENDLVKFAEVEILKHGAVPIAKGVSCVNSRVRES